MTNMSMSSSSSASSQGLMAAYNNGYYPLDHLQHHSLPVFNANMLSTSIMDDLRCGSGGGGDGGGGMVNTPPMLVSPYHYYSDDISTGYLEDALVEFTHSRPKRRRLQLVYNDEHEPTSSSYYSQPDKMGHWSNSNCMSLGEFTDDLNCMMMMMMDQDSFNDRVSGLDQHISNSLLDEVKMMSSCNTSYDFKASLDAVSGSAIEEPLSSSCSDKSIPSPSVKLQGEKEAKNRLVVKRSESNKRIVYPFALVKPGGVEGDITINDINERILMPPARPVRHPVGDFACRPSVVPDGPGLSGKAVVALTKIQTQGSGTITIIRTRG